MPENVPSCFVLSTVTLGEGTVVPAPSRLSQIHPLMLGPCAAAAPRASLAAAERHGTGQKAPALGSLLWSLWRALAPRVLRGRATAQQQRVLKVQRRKTLCQLYKVLPTAPPAPHVPAAASASGRQHGTLCPTADLLPAPSAFSRRTLLSLQEQEHRV